MAGLQEAQEETLLGHRQDECSLTYSETYTLSWQKNFLAGMLSKSSMAHERLRPLLSMI